jgi:hypothetical protein
MNKSLDFLTRLGASLLAGKVRGKVKREGKVAEKQITGRLGSGPIHEFRGVVHSAAREEKEENRKEILGDYTRILDAIIAKTENVVSGAHLQGGIRLRYLEMSVQARSPLTGDWKTYTLGDVKEELEKGGIL